MALVAAWKLHSKNAPTSDRLPHIDFRREVTCGLLKGVPYRQAGQSQEHVKQTSEVRLQSKTKSRECRTN